MTTPQGPPDDDPSIWARPGDQSSAAHTPEPSESPTGRIGSDNDETAGISSNEPPAPPEPPHLPPTSPIPPAAPPPDQPPYPQGYPPVPASGPADQSPSEDTTAPVKTKRRSSRLFRLPRLSRDPLSVVLVVVIVMALLAAGVLGAELYARHRADNVVAAAAQCVVHDKVSVSFGPYPFLLEHLTGDYHDITIQTGGNQIRSAKEMKADIKIDNVDLHGNANSKGTIGALDATVTWPSEGIKETVKDAVPFVGGFVNTVTTNPNDGTIELKGALGLGAVTVKPQVTNDALSLQVVGVTAMGFPVPRETAQSALDIFASGLTSNLPLGIHADSVQVTNDGVTAHFSTRNASIPTAQSDPCFAKL